MTKRPRTLTAAFVRTVGRPGVYGDGRGGRGLSLRVYRTANGRITKTWRQRVRIDGRLTSIGLGPYPEVTLADAREKALDNSRRRCRSRTAARRAITAPCRMARSRRRSGPSAGWGAGVRLRCASN
ncbi:MAG: Arm DNA-binding domain-containing protein [Gemmatimonadota bacterium]|nr:Arm DNA-binding domain-containing protein [Gemmatimonadota bacterium]